MKPKKKMPKHWLHAAQDRGRQDALNGVKLCPYVGKEQEWWEYGYSEGCLQKEHEK